jgi:RNA-directed DNA polymerase
LAERGVKSLFGGSKSAGRSGSESCSLDTGTMREPSRSRHGEDQRYADDAVVMCRSREEAEALELVGEILTGLGLELHSEKTRIVDLGEGTEGFDFLGCHFHSRVSGRLLERGIRRYYLHRWP